MTIRKIRFKKISIKDFSFIKSILQSEELMLLGWGKLYNDAEVLEWINKITDQYETYGYSYFIIKDLDQNKSIGIAGLIRTRITSNDYDEIAYIIKKEYQGKGYATETAKKLIQLAFQDFNLPQVIAQVATNNPVSLKVIENIGMIYYFSYQRAQNEMLKEHIVYSLKNTRTTSKVKKRG